MNQSLKIIFAGTPAFAATALAALLKTSHQVIAVYTQPDRPQGRGQKLMNSPIKTLALQQHLPVYQPVSLKTPEDQQQIAELQADVMVVAAYGLLLPLPVLHAPRLGCVNIHASLLPRWRGAAPIQRAILTGDTVTGISIMQMEAGLDTGPILYQATCPIHATDTSVTLHDRLAVLGATAIVTALDFVVRGEVHPVIQDVTLATYAHKIHKEEARLDWATTAVELERKVRAFNAWPVVFTYINAQMLRIWQAQVLSTEPVSALPGQVLHASNLGIDVATGLGVLRLLQLQVPGGKLLSVAEFMHAPRPDIVVGRRFA
ncbi:MAG: methionyl-tRNA formyltransferase [Gammaproteobacteria bacterium RIFCSPHIGHO2_12_FULL_41_20]|nr:MAG: methionyl-tRNA formyltransferase [Gammaproteobacteria bacterium RIFCSPHIGHO2_12_FULL_41_20]